VRLARIPYIVAVCLLVASCSPQVAPQERAPATDSIAPAPALPAASPTQVPPETAIQEIRNRYADVRRRRPSYREVKRDLTGLSTEGGVLQAFFEGPTLQLAHATFYGETGRTDREFYYDGSGRPFFVLEVESRYQEPLGATAGKQEYRYYFYDGQLIRLLADDRQVSADDAAYAARVKNVLGLSRRLLEVARQQP
jgi:hypothetical protein